MKRAAEFCQLEKIERFVPFQHELPNIYIWLCRGKDALFTHILFVETGCTSKLLRGEMCRSLIDSTDHEKHVSSGCGFQLTCLLCIYIAVGMS